MTETNSIILKNTSNQITLGNPDFLGPVTTLSASTPSASRTITIPDAGANSSLLLSAGTQTVSGNQTFSGNNTFSGTNTFSTAPVLTASSNQISVQSGGSGNSAVLNFAQPAGGSRTISFPDPLASANVIYDVLLQTISGGKSFSTGPNLTAASNQLQIQPNGSGNSIIVTASTPSGNRTYTVPDVGSNSGFQMGISNTVAVTATAAITAAQSGYVFYINSAAASVTLTLPSLTAGFRCRFIVTSSSLANSVTIQAPSTVLNCNVISTDGTVVASQPQNAKTNAIIGTTGKASDWYEVYCDGSNYWLTGATATHGSITFS